MGTWVEEIKNLELQNMEKGSWVIQVEGQLVEKKD